MRTPPISIVVPVYNLEFYIERCLLSLSAQTLADVEIIVVDDGSTDDSAPLIHEVADGDSRFRVIHQANGGHGAACNAGIEAARGEYVMIVDGDDYLDPTTCEEMYRRAVANDADLLMGNLRYVMPEGKLDEFRPIEIETERLLDEEDRARLFSNWATPCARIYRRSMFSDPAVRFVAGIIYADVNFAPKTIFAARRIYYVNKQFYNYDLTRPTQSMKQTDKRILNVVVALRDMLEFYKAKGAFETNRAVLLHYTLRHVIAWTEKVRGLQGFSQAEALGDIFSVLDEHFGDTWLGAPLEQEVGRRRALLVRGARPFRYAPLAWSWKVHDVDLGLDAPIERLLALPTRSYRGLKRRLKSKVIDRLAY